MKHRLINYFFMTICFIFFCCFLWINGALYAASLQSLQVQQEGNRTFIHATVEGVVAQHALILHEPERVVLDLENTTAAIPIERVNLQQGLIVQVRSGHPRPSVLRLVFDIGQRVAINTSVHALNGARSKVSIELIANAVNTHSERKEPLRETHEHTSFHAPTSVVVQHAPSKALRDVIVVLDPGHGGKDSGALGPGHTAEKNVVLAIAKRLKQHIDKQAGMRAVLTRTDDHYIGLRQRLNIARRYNADIFISIHADAFINKESHGASVFALSQTGATSEAARWLAEKENYSELGGVNLAGLNDRTGMIRTVLLDLSQTATITASLDMGTEVLRHLDKITNLHHSSVEQARFVVLKSPDIPSILIETGFITNPHEERKLINSSYQTELTQAIVFGLQRYFWEHPPEGTFLEAKIRAKLHVVQRGDSLPKLSQHYQVSMETIKTYNHLSHERLYIGQKLQIPPSWT